MKPSHFPPLLLEEGSGVKAEPSADQFLVSHGKSGVVGVFTADGPLALPRGCEVVVHTSRGVEIGKLLGPATIRQARLIGASSAGTLVRQLTIEDRTRRESLAQTESRLFEACRASASDAALEVLDVDLLFDGQHAIVQFVGAEADAERLAPVLEEQFKLTIRLENLATPTPAAEEAPSCDKPDCGKDAGGCTSCSTGGGCSSCGSSKVDMTADFGHLRTKMETNQRIPLA
jgi:hypothetical protein